ncbi:STAS domain-containing protein [Heliobacillus mobilis]|uniref:STAS domain-containing protein n=1 Tax=Heliobacterium mobile TaxID=28064 RepID=A0A6I3SKN3_HELMO|nr:STAS domain-containing protein [Heliobacterium mobile]MTV49440.1 STAS domain-containing protein [Heliobacterium mobile]
MSVKGQEAFTPWLSTVQKTPWVTRGVVSIEETERLGRALWEGMFLAASTGCLPEVLQKTLQEISVMGSRNHLTPTETAQFVFSMRPYVKDMVRGQGDNLLMTLLDEAGVYVFEVYLKSREEVILNQRQDLLELSTPVIRLWDGILAVPLIGTMDSKRTQQIMEKLLNMIVDTSARVTILDITGVPTVDTMVANHILKTAAAVRLLGGSLIITGISPAIAQTMVYMGVDLSSVITRSIMQDGIALALDMLDKEIVLKSHSTAG